MRENKFILQLARVEQLMPVPRTRTGQVSAQEFPQVHEPVLVDALLQRLSVHRKHPAMRSTPCTLLSKQTQT
jgi:hypothetical protein